jgi:hypothetical protein
MIRRFSEDLYLNRLQIENILPEHLQLFNNYKKKKFYCSLTKSQINFIRKISNDDTSMSLLFDALVQLHCPHPDDIVIDDITHGGLTDEEYRIFNMFYDELVLSRSRIYDFERLVPNAIIKTGIITMKELNNYEKKIKKMKIMKKYNPNL